MIRFTLRCDRGHGFEAWFGGNDDYDAQRERGLVACPFCDSTAVTKALMAPAVARGGIAAPTEAPVATGSPADGAAVAGGPPSSTAAPGSARPDPARPEGHAHAPAATHALATHALATHALATHALAAGRHAALREAMRGLAAKVRAETVDVGARFPEEARRIHYGEAEERAIRGRASPDEARALVEEGVRIAPVPVAPDEAN